MFGLRDRRGRAAARWVARMGNEHAAFDRATFERWRSAHPDNARAFEQAYSLWGLDLPVDQTSFAHDRGSTADTPVEPRCGAPLFAVAALVVAAVGGIVFERIGMFASGRHGFGHPGASNTVIAGDAPRTFRLSDGSLATLQPGSALEIAFSPDIRSLTLLRGQGRFDVSHDVPRPFQVRAGASLTIARGTLFDVRITARGVHVVLVRGAVDVARLVGLRPAGAVRKLLPGQKLLILPYGALGTPVPAKAGETAAVSMTTFIRTPVREAIAAINRRNARQIAIVGKLASTEAISGGFNAEDPEGFAGTLATIFDMALIRRENGDLLLSTKH